MFFKIGVLKNFAPEKHLRWSLFLIKLKKRLQDRCFPVNIAKFVTTAFFIEHFSGWSRQFNKVAIQYSIQYSVFSTFSSYQKPNVGWFLLNGFVDLVRVYSLHILVETISTRSC